MKIEPTKQDAEIIDSMQARSLLERWLKHKDSLNFNVGDILIKETLRGYGEKGWHIERASQKSSHPAKWVYLHKDKNGIGYIKKLSADGQCTIGYPQCLFDMDLDNVRFKVDADWQDAILLEGVDSYDPAKQHLEEKKLRAEIREYNLKHILKARTEEDKVAWLQANIGNQIWLGHDRTGDSFKEFTIVKVFDKQNYEGKPYKVVEFLDEDKKPKIEKVDTLNGTFIAFISRPRSIKDYK